MKKQTKTRAEILREELEELEEKENEELRKKRLEEYTEKYVGKAFCALKSRKFKPEIITRVDSVDVDETNPEYDTANITTLMTESDNKISITVTSVKINDFWFRTTTGISKKMDDKKFLEKFNTYVKILQAHVQLNLAESKKKK